MRFTLLFIAALVSFNTVCNFSFYFIAKENLAILKGMNCQLGTIQMQTALNMAEIPHIAPKMTKYDWNMIPGSKNN